MKHIIQQFLKSMNCMSLAQFSFVNVLSINLSQTDELSSVVTVRNMQRSLEKGWQRRKGVMRRKRVGVLISGTGTVINSGIIFPSSSKIISTQAELLYIFTQSLSVTHFTKIILVRSSPNLTNY